MMLAKDDMIRDIRKGLAGLAAFIGPGGPLNLTDINVQAEDFVAGLLNAIYGWSLINANQATANYPCIDLIDEGRKLGVQVTSETSSAKVSGTIECLKAHHLATRVSLLKVFMIVPKQRSYTVKATCPGVAFNWRDDVVDFDDALKAAQAISDLRHLERVHQFVTESLPVLFPSRELVQAVLRSRAKPPAINPFGDWELRSPEWAFFRALAIDPRDPSTLFAGLDQDQGVYRSRDGGKSWEPINGGLGNRFVNGIAVSSFDDRVYAATGGGLWCSRDRGEDWSEVEEFRGKPVLTVALSPHDPQLVLAGCQRPGGVSFAAATSVVFDSSSSSKPTDVRAIDGTDASGMKFSLDGGEHWKTVLYPETINGFWVDPKDSRVFAIASADDGLFYSRDGTEQIRRVDSFPADQAPLCVAIVPDGSRRILVGTARGGLFWSDDGDHWNQARGIPDVQVSDIGFVKTTPETVVAASIFGVYRSFDGGKEWHHWAEGLEYPWSMVMAETSDGSLVVGTSGGGAYRRGAEQSAWNPANGGFPPASAIRLRHANGWLFAGTSTGLWKSGDKGGSWRFAGLTGQNICSIALVAERAARVRSSGSTRGGLFVSRSGGASFDSFVRPGDQPIEVFAGTDEGRVYRSADSGGTWEDLTAPTTHSFRAILSITVSSGSPRRIGVLVEHEGFFLSDDEGKTWSSDSTQALGTAINLVERSEKRGSALFAMTIGGGFFTSADGGGSWVKAQGIPPDEILTSVTQHAMRDEVIFAASVRRAVYRSGDGGRTFDKIGQVPIEHDEDENELRWTSLAVRSAADKPVVLLLGSSRGAYLSRDEGTTWSPLPAGIHKSHYAVNEVLILDDTCVMATNRGILSRSIAD